MKNQAKFVIPAFSCNFATDLNLYGRVNAGAAMRYHQNMIIQQTSSYFLKQIKTGLFQLCFHFPASTNCFIRQERDGLTLIDAANSWNAKEILSALQAITGPLRRIIITHAHPDHAGAAAEISKKTGALVYVHEGDKNFLDGSASMSETPGFWLCRTILKAGKVLGILHPPPVKDLRTASDGEMIGNLMVIHTPGHTPGSISIFCQETKAIFCGDNLISMFDNLQFGLPWFTLDGRLLRRSMERYAELPASLLLSGHGPVYEREDLVPDLLKLLS